MSDAFGKENRATPAATLEQEILDPNHPKNEREWWAADTIIALRAEVEKLRAALHEAADELDAYYRAEYCGDHPYSKRKLAEAMRDNPARIAITPTPMEKT